MDLNAPLGMTPPPAPKRRVGLFVGLGVIVAGVAAIGTVIALSDPHAGEPTATATIPPPLAKASHGDIALAGVTPLLPPPAEPIARDAATDRTPTASFNRDPGAHEFGHANDVGTIENGVKVFRAPPSAQQTAVPQQSGGPLIIDVTRALDDPQHRPKMANAQPEVATPTPAATAPKIAIFVSGMGLNESATRTAIEVMPSPVTLAFVPYANTVAASVGAAKERGHEVLLQLPMQAAQGASPGPHALKASASTTETADDLAWLMGRMDGYDGVTNLLGASVSADTKAMTTVLKAVASRHVFYLDDGTSKRSVAVSVASSLEVPAVQADLVLDATSEPAVVRANLDHLVAIARRKGSAIGMASGLPEHLAEIAQFASGLRAQGITLVPVGTLVPGTSATTAR